MTGVQTCALPIFQVTILVNRDGECTGESYSTYLYLLFQVTILVKRDEECTGESYSTYLYLLFQVTILVKRDGECTGESYSTYLYLLFQVTILVKRDGECTGESYSTYHAQHGQLPSTFDDGRTEIGRSVQVREVTPNEHVEVHLNHIDTVIILRLIAARFYSVSIGAPEDLVLATWNNKKIARRKGLDVLRSSDAVFQLCHAPCPPRDHVDIFNLTPHRWKMSPSDAMTACRGEGLDLLEEGQGPRQGQVMSGVYLDACVFDLTVTGDLNFTKAALFASIDARRLLNNKIAQLDSSTTKHCFDACLVTICLSYLLFVV